MAVIVLVGTVTFGASLSSLVSHPSLYGWNWDYMLSAGGDLPQQKVTSLLDHDPYVAAWSGVYTTTLQINGQVVPVLGETPGTTVAPALLSGHNVQTAGQVVLGSLTLKQLGEHLGGTVEVSSDATSPERLRIVGTATLPAIGGSGLHLEMGVGAVLSYKLLPAVDLNPFGSALPGPAAALVRLRPHVDRSAAYRSLEQIAQETTNPENFGVGVIAVQRPAEILNYRSLGNTPVYLGVGLATGAVVALALTLIASVRRRRARPRAAQNTWLHRTAIGRHRRLACDHRRGHRGGVRSAPRNSDRALAVGPLRTRDQRRSYTSGPGVPGCPDSAGCPCTRQHRRRNSRPVSCSDANRSRTASRVSDPVSDGDVAKPLD